jgi:hypothetical protein
MTPEFSNCFFKYYVILVSALRVNYIMSLIIMHPTLLQIIVNIMLYILTVLIAVLSLILIQFRIRISMNASEQVQCGYNIGHAYTEILQ